MVAEIAPGWKKLTARFWETALSREDRLTAIRQIFFAAGNEVAPRVGRGLAL